ncbi:MAG: hypothetical protein ACI841_000111 [Planctomycetota bacterium]|jgi:hypothetical protein
MPHKLIACIFLSIVFGVPVTETWWHMRTGESWQGKSLIGPISKARNQAVEIELREASFIHESITPWYQYALTRGLGFGNEKAVLGRDDWIFYSDDLDLITQPTNLGPKSVVVRSIIDFKDQLAAEGVDLILLPVPAKSMVEANHLSRWTADLTSVANPQTQVFFESLRAAEVSVLELAPLFAQLRAGGQALYLERDSHWNHRCMREVAGAVAQRVKQSLGAAGLQELKSQQWATSDAQVEARGDTLEMLRLPEGRSETTFESMSLSQTRVEGHALDLESPILLLGDSFSGVFSDERFGLGRDGGLVEMLALELETSLDAIVIAGGASKAVRESLVRRAHALAGKRVVIWQFSMRDLVGDMSKWAPVDLNDVQEAQSASTALRVTAEVAGVSRISEEFAYDFCLVIHKYRILRVLEGHSDSEELWVAHVGMREFEDAEGAAIVVGQRLELALEPIEAHYNLEKTSWINDTNAGFTIWHAMSATPAD